uniref:Uncharacterized protein n=1 Tax=Arundo donax TaxID=35708 RepID=A0A0A9G8G4_ARUDO
MGPICLVCCHGYHCLTALAGTLPLIV